jgi:hypothetical protein
MLAGRDEVGESRMGEISMSGSTREREETVIGLGPFNPSSLSTLPVSTGASSTFYLNAGQIRTLQGVSGKVR